MGYETNYKLTCEPYNSDLIKEFFGDCHYSFYESSELKAFISNGSCKWYDHETEISIFSNKYSDYLFILEGIGEERFKDMWVKFFKFGKMYKQELRLEYKFDYNKLK